MAKFVFERIANVVQHIFLLARYLFTRDETVATDALVFFIVRARRSNVLKNIIKGISLFLGSHLVLLWRLSSIALPSPRARIDVFARH
jgi:hypothetical protein